LPRPVAKNAGPGYHVGMKLLAQSACLLLIVAALAWPALAQEPAAPRWKILAEGLEFAKLDAGGAARVGSDLIGVLRVDPQRYRFAVLATANEDDEWTAGQWRAQSGALAVFNAGQYAEDHSYLGFLAQDGQILGRMVGHLEALFLAEPNDPALPPARILDLRYTAFDPRANPYRQAAQSLMLLDRFGQIRVRRSPRVAHRTAVAADARGRILVIVTEGAHTLWELAQFLAGAGLDLREVMLMDGGGESQVDVKVGDFRYQQYGGPSSTPDLPWPRQALPVALAVFPR